MGVVQYPLTDYRLLIFRVLDFFFPNFLLGAFILTKKMKLLPMLMIAAICILKTSYVGNATETIADSEDSEDKDLSSDQSDLTHDKEEEDEEEEEEEEEDEEEEDEEEDKDLSSDQSDLTSYRLKWLKSSRRAESPHIHRQKRCQGKYRKCSKSEDCCSGRRCLGNPTTHQFCL